MTKILKKHAEIALRDAAIKNNNKGRSMTKEAITKAALCSYSIVELFCLFVEKSYPKIGRGSRLTGVHVENAYNKMYIAIREFVDSIEEESEEE